MNNLTEQWKKGELPEGWYYIKCEDGEYIDYYEDEIVGYETKIGWRNYNGIEKVVGRVPSCELWKAVHEQWKVLLEENKRLKHDVGNLGYKIKNQRHEIDNRLKEIEKLKEYERTVTSYSMKPIDYDIACETVNKLLDEKKALKEENIKLKELLKECSPYISRSVASRMIKNSAGYKKDAKLLAKINQVLGEE